MSKISTALAIVCSMLTIAATAGTAAYQFGSLNATVAGYRTKQEADSNQLSALVKDHNKVVSTLRQMAIIDSRFKEIHDEPQMVDTRGLASPKYAVADNKMGRDIASSGSSINIKDLENGAVLFTPPPNKQIQIKPTDEGILVILSR